MIVGRAHMLDQNEELWEKTMPLDVIKLLKDAKFSSSDYRGTSRNAASETRPELDLTRVVTFQVPHNAAVQIYDYKADESRVVFGPSLVMLGPEEQFTLLTLSGGKPKQSNRIKSLCLRLGPDVFTDVITVETSDHARLSLQIAYNWHFEVPSKCSAEDAAKLFSVPDFIGEACKTLAARIRGKVANVSFDDFHKVSSHGGVNERCVCTNLESK